MTTNAAPFYTGTVKITEYFGNTDKPCQTMTADYGDPQQRRFVANWVHTALCAGNTIKTEPLTNEKR